MSTNPSQFANLGSSVVLYKEALNLGILKHLGRATRSAIMPIAKSRAAGAALGSSVGGTIGGASGAYEGYQKGGLKGALRKGFSGAVGGAAAGGIAGGLGGKGFARGLGRMIKKKHSIGALSDLHAAGKLALPKVVPAAQRTARKASLIARDKKLQKGYERLLQERVGDTMAQTGMFGRAKQLLTGSQLASQQARIMEAGKLIKRGPKKYKDLAEGMADRKTTAFLEGLKVRASQATALAGLGAGGAYAHDKYTSQPGQATTTNSGTPQ